MKLYFELMGLDPSRLVVHQHVFANEVYLPMEGGCQDPVYNTWQILTMRQFFLKAAGAELVSVPVKAKPVMLLLRRSSSSRSTRNSGDLVRQWSEPFTQSLMKALASRFPEYEVVLFDDKDPKLMTCAACQIREFAVADVAIGMHGAGLSNIVYMKPNSAVVEFCPYGNDGRCLLGGGPFNRAALLLSHDYLVHYAVKAEYVFDKSTMSATFDLPRFLRHVESFLVSTGRIAQRSNTTLH
jgi:hypothetical protein